MNPKQRIQERREQQRKKKRVTYILVALGAALVLSAVFLLLSNANQVDLAEGEIIRVPVQQPPLADGSSMGDPDAPVTIINYSDFGCPHCANFALSTGKQLAEEFVAAGEVHFEFRSVGALLGVPATVQAAEAAYCAADQNAFFPYHDLIFANQAKLFVVRDADISPTLVTFAEILELDADAFSRCLDSGKYSKRVSLDEAAARQAGVTGTPTFIVNGQVLSGNQPIENFRQVIEAELAAAE
ncbi:MAG: thioredoxin domain-containing protein [Anaerolineales bacterium]|nr:thioredoxin domain-containing protein [Anaerolineales bacterium]